MKTIESDIGHAVEIHKLLMECVKDAKQLLGPMSKGIEIPKLDFWLHAFNEPNFFCLYMKHGKKSVGFVMGKLQPYYAEPQAELSLMFVRRGFRSFKFKRGLVVALRKYLLQNEIKRVSVVQHNPYDTRLLRGE